MLEARNAGKAIADARGEMGDGGRHLPLLRRRARAAARRHDPGRRRPGLHRARAARRRRADHAVELPADDRLVEARAGAGGRQHGRAEARRADAADARCASPSSRSRRACPRASSTSSSARAAPAGSAWSSTPTSRKIAFTGSTEVGRSIAAGAAATIKRVTLELGGKSANIVFADADLEAAAAAAPLAVFGNAGQDCCARSRILVQESALERFLELLERARQGAAGRRPAATRTRRWGR